MWQRVYGVLIELTANYNRYILAGGKPLNTLGEFMELPTGENYAQAGQTYSDKARFMLVLCGYADRLEEEMENLRNFSLQP